MPPHSRHDRVETLLTSLLVGVTAMMIVLTLAPILG